MKTIVSLFACFQLATQVSAQNIGIGTPNPTKGKLEIVGVAGSGKTNAIFGSNTTGISLQQDWPTIGFNQYRDNTVGNGRFMSTGYAAIQYLDPNGGGMYIDMLGNGPVNSLTGSGTRAITITNNGNVGILNNGGDGSLTVSRGDATNTAIFYGTTYHSYFNNFTNENTFLRAGKANGAVYINDIPGGFVYIGTGNGTSRVGINTGTVFGVGTLAIDQVGDEGIGLVNELHGGYRWEINNEQYGTNSQSITLRYSGRPGYPIMGWFSPEDGSYFANSDERVKQHIRPLEPQLPLIMQLRPARYEMKTGETHPRDHIGLIAQQAKLIYPEIVDIRNLPVSERNPVGDFHGMNYSYLGVIAIKGIQEMQTEIEELKAEIRELKKIVNNKIKNHE